MITFILLTIILAILVVFTILTISIGGVAFILVFGDIIIFAMLLIWIFKHVFKKNK